MNTLPISTSFFIRGAFAILCLTFSALFLISGCEKPPIDKPDPDPEPVGIDIPFRDYVITQTQCRWVNLKYDGKVILINDNETMENFLDPGFLDFYYNYVAVDFSKYSIILVSGTSNNRDAYIPLKFQKLSDNKYIINAELFLNPGTTQTNWHFAIWVDKISDESTIELKTKTAVAETDYYYGMNGEKVWYALRKDYVVCKTNSGMLCGVLSDEHYFSGGWAEYVGYWGYDIFYARIKPNVGALEDIRKKPQVQSIAYGYEITNYYPTPIYRGICFPWGGIVVQPKEGITVEQILNELGFTEYTFDFPMGAPYEFLEGTRVLFNTELNTFEICRKIYESGMCEYAMPNLVPQVSLCN